MRLLLDAHFSAQRVARALRGRGHDVRAIIEEQELDGLPDPEVLALVAATIRQEYFGAIIAGVDALLAASPEQRDWIDRTEWLSRGNLA